MSERTVLIIDDELLVLEAMRMFLEGAGIRVLSSSSGADGIQIARENRPNLILSDYAMPDMNGFQVLTALQNDESTRDIPVVLFTAHAHPQMRTECLQSGAAAVFQKGIDADELLGSVNRLAAN